MRQLPVIDSKTYSPWSNISTVGLELAASCAQAGFLDWASNLAQLRHLKAQKRRTAKRAPPPAAAAPRRPSKYARRLFIWGFIGTNVAISIAWARAADEAAVTGMTMRQSAAASAALRVPGGLSHMADNVALTAQGLREGRWWTLLTCGASHFAPAYLIVNVCEFYTWASRCFDLGLGPGAVAGIMIGSTVCCGLAGLAGEDPGKPAVLMGASGIVSGLRNIAGVAAILLEPVMGFRVPGVCDFHCPIFTVVLMGFAKDLAGGLSQWRAEAAPSMVSWLFCDVPRIKVGHAGHLGGTAFGVAYWYLWLRSRFGTW